MKETNMMDMSKEIKVYSVKMENGTSMYFKSSAAARSWKNQDDRRVYMGRVMRSKSECWYLL